MLVWRAWLVIGGQEKFLFLAPIYSLPLQLVKMLGFAND